MGIYDLYKNEKLKIWQDVFSKEIDDKTAPDLGDAIEGKDTIYSNSEEFFARTYMTKSMEDIIQEVADTLKNDKGGTIYLLTSLYGGGKTHMMITLYHAFSKPESLKKVNKSLFENLVAIKPYIIVIDGSRSNLAPTPLEPYKGGDFTIKTLWGILAYKLGAYAKVMQLDSENAHPPRADNLIDILKEPKKPILILMDEILPYIYTVSKAKELEDYGKNLLMFMSNLARAVERTPNVALVVSLQVEIKKDQIIEESIYTGLAQKLYNELHRETTRNIVPVTPTDVVQILKRRIFQEITKEEAEKAKDLLLSKYKEYPEFFGLETDWEYSSEENKKFSAKETYPFHPKYLEVIQEIISRNKDMGRTRDAIRLTRKVVRNLLEKRENPSFIMPWHVDLGDPDIRSFVLTESYREFRDIASKDIVDEDGNLGSISNCSKPMLALKITTSIFLKVYTYETFKIPLRTFPTLKDVMLMTYDPETFSVEGFEPPDIKTILDEMNSVLNYFNFQDNRYWFDPYLPVIDVVEKRAKEILYDQKITLYKLLTERAKELLAKKPKKGERSEWIPFLFNEKRTQLVGYGDIIYGSPEIKDVPEHQLIVFVKPRENIPQNVIEDLILRYNGGLRKYRNTITVVIPNEETDFDKMLEYASKIIAENQVNEELKEIFKNDEEILKNKQNRLRQYVQEVINKLNTEILQGLTSIAYPRMNDEGRDVVWYTKAKSTDSIIDQIEKKLEEVDTGPKLRKSIGFYDLTSFLKTLLGWDLSNGDKSIEFREIVEVFLTNTAAPFTKKEVLEKAILEGVKNLEIGIKTAGKIYWKKIEEKGAEIPSELRDDSEILPWQIAAKKLAEELLSNEGQFNEGGKVHTVWYEVEYMGQSYKLKDLINQPNKLSIVREGIIKKRDEVVERGILVEISPSLVEINEGEEIKVNVSVKPVGGYDSEVKLIPEEGEIRQDSSNPPFKAVWRIGPISFAGTRSLTVEAQGVDGYNIKKSIQVIVKSLEEEIPVTKLEPTHVQQKLVEISSGDLTNVLMAFNKISQMNASAKVNFFIKINGNINLNGSDADLKLSEILIQKVSELSKSIPSLKIETTVSIKLENPIILDTNKIAVLNVLSEKSTFKIRVRKNNDAR